MSAPGEKRKVSRKKKDPDAPKRSLSAYMFLLMKTEILLELKTPVFHLDKLVKLLVTNGRL